MRDTRSLQYGESLVTTVCVTGMHRSGTSFAARALQLLGVSLGDPDQLMAAGPDNEAGYWENRPLKEFDDELLADLGGSWDQPPVLDRGWANSPELDRSRDEARELLDGAFAADRAGDGGGGPIGFKDPRLCLLLPFWRTVTDVDATVVIVRDPREVASSLHRRNGLGAAQSAVLWLRYLLAAEIDDPDRLLLTDRQFFDDLPTTLDVLAAHAGLPRPSADTTSAVAAHLDPELLHPADPQPARDPVSSLALDVWNRGAVTTEPLPATLVEALASGWLRPPVDGEILARARAKVIKQQATLRRRGLQKKALDAERATFEDHDPEPSTPVRRDGPQS